MHVTLRFEDGLPSLRRRATYRALAEALGGGCERFGLRLVHGSALSNHLHLMVEALDRGALARGMQGLSVCLARALNRAWGCAGRVFADLYHAHVLRGPREVRNALAYVLQNARHHRIDVDGAYSSSSGPRFDGWLQGERSTPAQVARPSWLRAARTWLLGRGWRVLGLLEVHAAPSGR